ncbi:hypothetical protein B0H10DRAFT_1946747 [Mycena sp. CBHHK59/15]|nr:hypothetical protein B0H10DRAFT_1946747 [Mycena sp. CBHHK59/15]
MTTAGLEPAISVEVFLSEAIHDAISVQPNSITRDQLPGLRINPPSHASRRINPMPAHQPRAPPGHGSSCNSRAGSTSARSTPALPFWDIVNNAVLKFGHGTPMANHGGKKKKGANLVYFKYQPEKAQKLDEWRIEI